MLQIYSTNDDSREKITVTRPCRLPQKFIVLTLTEPYVRRLTVKLASWIQLEQVLAQRRQAQPHEFQQFPSRPIPDQRLDMVISRVTNHITEMDPTRTDTITLNPWSYIISRLEPKIFYFKEILTLDEVVCCSWFIGKNFWSSYRTMHNDCWDDCNNHRGLRLLLTQLWRAWGTFSL